MSDPLDYKAEDAYYGPLGELARRHQLEIEINLPAFYAMLLPAIGWLVGRRAMIQISRDKHFCNLFTVIVGRTGCGKGMSWNIVQDLIEQIDPTCHRRLHRDVASAPGLIGLVRDAHRIKKDKKVIEDEGVADKRCFVLFEEMDNLFTAMGRQGSTLDKVWNMAYDGRSLENNKRDPEKATNPHISCVCQITDESFRDAVRTVSKGRGSSNGFFNRFITVRAVKERALTRGGTMPEVGELIQEIQSALASLGSVDSDSPKIIQWHPSTYEDWDAFVESLDSEHPFLNRLGGLAARLKPNVMRIAMLFAVIDRDEFIRPDHLRAAKAFCLHCIDDSRGFFHPSSSSFAKPSLDDRVLAVATKDPCAATGFHNRLGNKCGGEALQASLSRLVEQRTLIREDFKPDHGKTVPRWRLADTLAEEPERNGPEFTDKFAEHPDVGQELFYDCGESLREFVEIDGMRLAYGAAAAFKCDTAAQALDGRRLQIKKGLECCLAKVAVDATRAQRDRTHSWLREHTRHVCVIVGETPVLTERAALRVPVDDFAIA
jgi:hypothetical protein